MADWGKWVDLELDDEEMVDQAVPMIAEKPRYPWGTRICLTGRELELCGLPLPSVGDQIDLRAFGEVTSVSDGEGGQRVEIQLTKLKLENEDDEDAESEV